MKSGEFIRLVDTISRERGLDKNLILDQIERALSQAAAKRFDAVGDFTVSIDRETGEIRAFEDETPVELEDLGRIVANVAKQAPKRVGLRFRPTRAVTWDHRKLGGTY